MQMFSTASKITTTAMHNFKGTCFSTENSVGKEALSLEVKINSIID